MFFRKILSKSSATSNLALWREPLKSLKGDHSWLRYIPTPTPSGGIPGGSPWFEASDDVFTPLRIALCSWKRPGHHSGDVKICQDQDMSRAHRCPSARRKFCHPSHPSHQASASHDSYPVHLSTCRQHFSQNSRLKATFFSALRSGAGQVAKLDRSDWSDPNCLVPSWSCHFYIDTWIQMVWWFQSLSIIQYVSVVWMVQVQLFRLAL